MFWSFRRKPALDFSHAGGRLGMTTSSSSSGALPARPGMGRARRTSRRRPCLLRFAARQLATFPNLAPCRGLASPPSSANAVFGPSGPALRSMALPSGAFSSAAAKASQHRRRLFLANSRSMSSGASPFSPRIALVGLIDIIPQEILVVATMICSGGSTASPAVLLPLALWSAMPALNIEIWRLNG